MLSMLRLSAGLHNQPVLSLRLGGPIATAQEPVINPHNLKIMGWWCVAPSSPQELVLLAEDVREITPSGLMVNDEEVLSTADELVRHRSILDIHFGLIDKLVKTEHQKLGKVSDFSFDDSLFIQKMYVSRSLTKVFTTEDTLVVDRSQILEVTDHYILVKDTDVKVTNEELAGAPEAAAA
jgi:hypothetical protein